MPPPTTKLDRFFLAVNRTISLLILLGLLIAAIAVAFILIPSKPKEAPGEQRVSTRETVQSETIVLGFGNTEEVYGTDIEMIRLNADSGSGKYSSHADQTRNVLFLDGTDKAARWLFKDHKNVIVKLDQLRESTGPKEPTKTLALYVEFRTPGAATDRSTSTVGLARPDGTGFTPVLRDMTRVLSCRRIDKNRIAILFQRGTALLQADIALEGFAVLRQRQVEKVPTAL